MNAQWLTVVSGIVLLAVLLAAGWRLRRPHGNPPRPPIAR